LFLTIDRLNSSIMSLSSTQLDAFVAVARARHFSNAAKVLGITQSALSLRIKNLEEEMGTTLFIRGRAGVRLTDTAQGLLRYCQIKDALEAEMRGSLLPSPSSRLAGVLRIGGFSSVMRSAILPALGPLLRENRQVKLHMMTRELDELPELLRGGEADFVVLDRKLEDEALETIPLGEEENLLVSSAKHRVPENILLDHDERDQTSIRFFQIQTERRKAASLQRQFLDDIYGILDGVRHGLGRAVLPKHLISDEKSLRVEPGFKALRMPVVLHFFKQPYYSKLHQEALRSLQSHVPGIFGRKP
jgi:DNA-binding transcriptional LysR family regulator